MKTRAPDLLRKHFAPFLLSAAAILALGSVAASATEIIPSIGITKPVHAEEADANLYGGLAIRGELAPILKAEVGASYREETHYNGQLKTRQWPVTASLWLVPIPALYAGGGVGWYHTSYDYSPPLSSQSDTKQQFGVHLGGGVTLPLTPHLGLDLNGRYIFMDKVETKLPPNEFDPDFWSTTLGLAIHF